MKKLLSLSLVLALVLSFSAAAFADDAPEFSLPVYSSAAEVDIEEVLSGNTLGALLDAFGSVQQTYYLKQEQPDGVYEMDFVDTNYLIDGVYYLSGTQTDRTFNSTTSYFYECSEDDPVEYYLFPNGLEKVDFPVEYYLEGLDYPLFPSKDTEADQIEVLSAEEADGLYVIKYRVVYADGYDPMEATVRIDPATSLIKGFTIENSSNTDIGIIKVFREGTVEYGVDSEPLYELRG